MRNLHVRETETERTGVWGVGKRRYHVVCADLRLAM